MAAYPPLTLLPFRVCLVLSFTHSLTTVQHSPNWANHALATNLTGGHCFGLFRHRKPNNNDNTIHTFIWRSLHVNVPIRLTTLCGGIWPDRVEPNVPFRSTKLLLEESNFWLPLLRLLLLHDHHLVLLVHRLQGAPHQTCAWRKNFDTKL